MIKETTVLSIINVVHVQMHLIFHLIHHMNFKTRLENMKTLWKEFKCNKPTYKVNMNV